MIMNLTIVSSEINGLCCYSKKKGIAQIKRETALCWTLKEGSRAAVTHPRAPLSRTWCWIQHTMVISLQVQSLRIQTCFVTENCVQFPLHEEAGLHVDVCFVLFTLQSILPKKDCVLWGKSWILWFSVGETFPSLSQHNSTWDPWW